MTRNLLSITGVLAGLALIAPAGALAATQGAPPPAGGAALDQILIATTGAMILNLVLFVLGFGHRTGRVATLGRLAGFAERLTGVQGWASLPTGVATVSLITALFGMLWDISLHVGQGRDAGPLANPAHYFILFGLFGIFAAGFFAMVLPKERPSTTALSFAGFHAPLGGVMLLGCASFALAGFPLDDVWHRLFGQDVTLWGPTHLMLIGGAGMTLVGIAVLLTEAQRGRESGAVDLVERDWMRWAVRLALPGAFLIGLSVFQGEYDFGMEQFQLVLHPMLIMLAAAAALVTARIWMGTGAALAAALFFLVIRGIIAVLVGPVLGEPTPYFPLYLVEAGIVEVVALMLGTTRTLRFGAVCGVAVGTFGLAAEWGWSHVFFRVHWPAELFPEGALLGLAMAISGALIGAWIGERLASDRLPRTAALRPAAVLGALAVTAMVVVALYTPSQNGITARVTLAEVSPAPHRTVNATVRMSPADAADGAYWLRTIAWQGGGLDTDALERIGPGVYRTVRPLPVYGDWKTAIRLHDGNSLIALPIYMPEDRAIPVAGVAAPASFERSFIPERTILQRERKDAPLWLWTAGMAVVLVIALMLLTLLAWSLHRLGRAGAAQGVTEPAGRAAPEGSKRLVPSLSA